MTASIFSLDGKLALITGATGGIGLEIARQMALQGARIVLSGEREADCARAVDLLAREGLNVSGLVCDLRQRAASQQLVDDVLSMHGRIDILVCNAGVAPHMGPIGEASDDDWNLTMDVNLRSALWLTSRAIPQMADRREGAVILMSSIAGVRGNRGLGLYALSKAGLTQLARNLAVQWGPSNVRVNAIAPGVIDTAFARPLTDNDAVLARRIALTPLRRIGEPRDVAGVAVMLASRAGAFITGQNLVVDGGTTIGDGS